MSSRAPDGGTEPSDVDLVARVAAGDEAALATLYDRHSGIVYALLRRMLRDDAAAEDLLQEVFYQFWRLASRFDSQRGSLRGWLLVMARNRAISLLRQRPDTVSDESYFQLAAPARLQDSMAVQNQLISRIRGLLAQMPDEQRQVFECAYFEGLTHSEIAERTGQPLGTVKTRLRTALGSLRQAFEV